jgi:hypothetical protein
MEYQHGEISHTNLLSHAKKKAKKLFGLAKNDAYNLKIENLSQAKEIIARIHGYENWHILEKVATSPLMLNQDYENLEMNLSGILFQIENDAQVKENGLINNPNEPGYVYSVITFRHLRVTHYGDIFALKDGYSILLKEIEMALDREFSIINLDIIHTDLSIKENHPTVKKPAEFNNNLQLDSGLIEILKVPYLSQRNTLSEDEFGVYCVLSIKTPVLAQTEHLSLLDNMKTLLGSISRITEVKDNIEINEMKKVLAYQNQKLSHVISDKKTLVKENNSKNQLSNSSIMDCLITGAKYISVFENKKLNWNIRFDSNGNYHHLLVKVFAQNTKELDEILFLTQGYQKEIEKNTIEHIASSLNEKSLLVNYKENVFQKMSGNLFENLTSIKNDTARNTLVFGRPGCGKSMLLNILNLSQCMQAQSSNVPKIRLIDIGPSSSGFFSLIKNSLPEFQRHHVGYYCLQMTNEYAVNLFDTELGARYPTYSHKAFLMNFMLLLVTDINRQQPEDGMTSLVHAVVENMYEQVSDKNMPKLYDRGIEKRVDAILAQTEFVLDNRTSWWEVVDYLFSHNHYHEAKLAQRHAVPTLSDATYIALDDKMREIYSKVTTSNGENLIEYFNRSITDILSQYRNLAGVTVFDIDEQNMFALDLDKVAKTGSIKAEQQTAIMYMVALYLANKNLKNPDFIPESFLSGKENDYLNYHKEKSIERASHNKSLMLDEIHRISRFPLVIEQIIVAQRESRLQDIQITLATQSIDDIHPIMQSFMNNIIIMDSGTNAEQDKLSKILGLGALQKRQLKNIHGPRHNHSGVFMVKNRDDAELISLNISLKLIIAFSTTFEDVIIRDKLNEKIGLFSAIEVLAKYYPQGIKHEVEKRKEKERQAGKFFADGEKIIEQLLEELLYYWHQMQLNK